jgi:predicted enzyme related to lactoylglutathione lyase
MPNRFCRYVLRSLDVDAARVFYREIFGPDFWGDAIDIAPLPARAAARGVPGYWLGHVGVDDVVPPMYRFLEAGATRLDPPPTDGRDTGGVALRDPFGAIVALAAASDAREETRVAWHLLGARDAEQAIQVYGDILGWSAVERQDLGARGRHVTFSFDRDGRVAGSASDIANRPHVHAQWLYFFAVPDFDAAIARVRELGGLVLQPSKTPDGHRVVASDDPQGAAFGIYETVAGTQSALIT